MNKWANIIAKDKVLGNEAASLIDPDDGSNTFGRMVLTKQSDSSPGWATSTPLSPTGSALFDEFTGQGPYTNLNAIGITDAKVAQYKAALIIEYGDLPVYINRLGAFIAENGYVVTPGAA